MEVVNAVISQIIYEKILKLKTIRTDKVLIKILGQINDSQMQVLDMVQLKIKHRHQNEFVFIEALCVRFLCTPLKMQEISSAQENYEHLSILMTFLVNFQWIF